MIQIKIPTTFFTEPEEKNPQINLETQKAGQS